MKTPRLLILLLAALLSVLTPRPAQAIEEVSFDFFYDSLAPYGEWIDVGDYGLCWRPTEVERDWAPYADGYWAFTDAGWTWVSYEDFGGIVYHYGRWVFLEDDGWCWVPKYDWGPAWVSWRESDDYVGWAPLPPEARWEPEIGLSIWVDRQYDIGPGYYNFCHARDFGAPVLRPVILNRRENVTIIRRTVNITNITYNTGYGSSRVIYNGGLNYEAINRRSERRVPALKLVQNGNFDFAGSRGGERDRGGREGRRNFNAQAVGNQLVVNAPVVKPLADAAPFRSRVRRTVSADKVSRGWNGVQNDAVRRELRQEIQQQSKGLTPQTTPARPMAAADVQAVPTKADAQAASPVATRDKRERPDRDRKERTSEVAAQPPTVPNAPAQIPVPPQAPVTAVPPQASKPPQERAADRPMRERVGEPEKAVAGQPVLRPFNPNPEAGQTRGVTPPMATDPRTAAPGDITVPGNIATPGNWPTRDGRKPSERPTGDVRQPDRNDDRRGDMRRQQVEAATQEQQQKALTEQEGARRKQADGAAAAQRAAEVQRGQQPVADRQKMQADQENAGRRQAEMQRQRESTAVGERQRQQAEQNNRAAQQQAEAATANQKQMEAQQRAGREAASSQDAERGRKRENESRRRQQPAEQAPQQQPQAAQQQMQAAQQQQQRAAQDAQRQQAQRASGEQQRQQPAADQVRQAQEGQRRQMESQRQQQRPSQPAVQPAPNGDPQPGAVPAEDDRRGKKKGRDK